MIQTIFENEHFVAIDKPSGWLTTPARQGGEDQRPCVTVFLRLAGARIFPVHRLDFEVSGLVLLAKDDRAHRAANGWFEGRQVRKRYEALTEGASGTTGDFEWTSQLLRGKKRAYESEHGKPAVTRASCLGAREFRGQSVLWWRLEPLTGRSHQLRFELAKHGFPILGDLLYGAYGEFERQAIALRSVALDFSECKEAGEYGLPGSIEIGGLANV